MKKIYFLSFLLLSIITFIFSAKAYEVNDEIYSEISDELNNFENSLPKDVLDFIPNGALDGNFSTLLNSDFGEKDYLELAVSYLFSGLDTVLKSFASILAILILTGLLNKLTSSLSESGLEKSFSICSTLCAAITVFNICNILVENVYSYLKILCNVMNAFIPIMLTLMTMSGNISSAVVSNGSMILFINIVEGFLLICMMPLIKMSLSFACVRSLNSEFDLSGITKTVKNTFTSVTVFIMSIFMFVLSYKNTLSQSADSISIKTARFAISSAVPLVGSSVNEALRTVTSSLSYIKKSTGIIAIIAIAVIMLPIIINLFLNKISFSILSSMARLIGSGNEGAILDEADSTCSFLLTIICCTCVLFIFALTIFIKTGVNIGA